MCCICGHQSSDGVSGIAEGDDRAVRSRDRQSLGRPAPSASAPWVEVASSLSMKPLGALLPTDGVLWGDAAEPKPTEVPIASKPPLAGRRIHRQLTERHCQTLMCAPCSIDTTGQRWAWHGSDPAQPERATSRVWFAEVACISYARFVAQKPGMGSWSWPGVLAATCCVLDGALEASYPRTTSDGKCKACTCRATGFYYLPVGPGTCPHGICNALAPSMSQSRLCLNCWQARGLALRTLWSARRRRPGHLLGRRCGTLGLVRPPPRDGRVHEQLHDWPSRRFGGRVGARRSDRGRAAPKAK